MLDLVDIHEGNASLGIIVDALLEADENPDRFGEVRAAIRSWLQSRISRLSAMSCEVGRNSQEQEFFTDAADRWQNSLNELDANQPAFIPDHVNAATGIRVPTNPEDCNDEFIYGMDLIGV